MRVLFRFVTALTETADFLYRFFLCTGVFSLFGGGIWYTFVHEYRWLNIRESESHCFMIGFKFVLDSYLGRGLAKAVGIFLVDDAFCTYRA